MIASTRKRSDGIGAMNEGVRITGCLSVRDVVLGAGIQHQPSPRRVFLVVRHTRPSLWNLWRMCRVRACPRKSSLPPPRSFRRWAQAVWRSWIRARRPIWAASNGWINGGLLLRDNILRMRDSNLVMDALALRGMQLAYHLDLLAAVSNLRTSSWKRTHQHFCAKGSWRPAGGSWTWPEGSARELAPLSK